MSDVEVLGTVTEAANKLGVDAAEVWEMVAAGRLQAERPDEGAKWVISRGGTRDVPER